MLTAKSDAPPHSCPLLGVFFSAERVWTEIFIDFFLVFIF